MARPLKWQSLINRINEHDEARIESAIKLFGELNLEVPELIRDLVAFAKKGEAMSSSQLNAVKTAISLHSELADTLRAAAKKLEEDNTEPGPRGERHLDTPSTIFSSKAVN